MADDITYTIRRMLLDEDQHEVTANDRYIGRIRKTAFGKFAAEAFTQGDVGTAETFGGALDLIINATRSIP